MSRENARCAVEKESSRFRNKSNSFHLISVNKYKGKTTIAGIDCKRRLLAVIYFANYQFSDPECLLNWTTSEKSGIYAILVQDPTSRSKPYKVIYFGESEDMSERGFFKSHYRYDRWIREAGKETEIYISVFPMPGSTPQLRQGIEAFLIKYYRPSCNL